MPIDLNKGPFIDAVAESIYDIKQSEALEKGICLRCKKPAVERIHTEAGRKEYLISGLCEECFDAMF